MSHPVFKVRDSASASVAARHPWLLANSLQKTVQPIAKDSVVDLVDSKQRFVGRGIFNPDSKIAVRVYTWDQSEQIDAAFFRSRIRQAIATRGNFSSAEGQRGYTARRLIFSEADRLSGLIVEAYGPYVVLQITASGLMARLDDLVTIVQEELAPQGILLLVDESTAAREGIAARHEVLAGEIPSDPLEIVENDVLFYVDLMTGQKTGYYLDQRQNRMAAVRWIEEDARVLDVCSYSGAFACTIAKHKPQSNVTAIDASQKAIEMAGRNAELNGLGNIQFECNDFYSALDGRLERNELYSAIILDPPKMAGARSQVQRALAAYHRLNFLAARLLKPGGVLVTCSCSGRVSKEDFRQMLLGVSKRTGREIQILEQRGAADDHPTIINCPETDYLKCFVVKIF
jgi:23S rRNA (cytosine1962-C5)-methyltransferase